MFKSGAEIAHFVSFYEDLKGSPMGSVSMTQPMTVGTWASVPWIRREA